MNSQVYTLLAYNFIHIYVYFIVWNAFHPLFFVFLLCFVYIYPWDWKIDLPSFFILCFVLYLKRHYYNNYLLKELRLKLVKGGFPLTMFLISTIMLQFSLLNRTREIPLSDNFGVALSTEIVTNLLHRCQFTSYNKTIKVLGDTLRYSTSE